MGDLIVIIIVLIILGGAIYKLYIDKKNGVKCSGCPSCKVKGTCSSNQENKKYIELMYRSADKS